MKRNAWRNTIGLLFGANLQAFRNFRRSLVSRRRDALCFGLLISLCAALIITGFSTVKGYQKQAAAPYLSAVRNQLYLHMQSNADDTLPTLDTMRQFSASNSDVFKGILPYLTADIELRAGRTRGMVHAVGTSTEFAEYETFRIQEGRFFRYFDTKEGQKPVVLGSNAAEKFFPHDSALGQQLLYGDESYTVIGVLADSETAFGDTVFFPHTLCRQVFKTAEINQFLVFPEWGKGAEAKQMLKSYLTDTLEDATLFSLYTQGDLIRRSNPMTASLSWILWLGTAILLLLLSLLLFWNLRRYFGTKKEEWTLRFYAGARPIQIFWQILIEGKYHGALYMTAGILLGIAGSLCCTKLLGLPLSLCLGAVLAVFLLLPTLAVFLSLHTAIQTVKENSI